MSLNQAGIPELNLESFDRVIVYSDRGKIWVELNTQTKLRSLFLPKHPSPRAVAMLDPEDWSENALTLRAIVHAYRAECVGWRDVLTAIHMFQVSQKKR
ncbi:hypothetical protein EDF62_1606 [Leucobacter luti]|uniref:Uncharacterized protein n=1 Tax=Leucobacter luti TaxID=340320 RepID=A0A4R6RYZ4_9MICO|nr:hypothetical protein [Leucobacter luti]TDP92399.1 hypothetical protein EDF62_1606 [Leucobacter luti]